MTHTDAERLRLFCKLVDTALARRAITQGTIAANLRLQATEGGDVGIEIDLGDVEDLRSLLIEVRKFFADKHPVHFPQIAKIVERAVTDATLREAGRINYASWKRALGEGGGLLLHVNGVNYKPQHCFDLIINGKVFHDDAAKAAELDRLEPMFQAHVRRSVNRLVLDALHILCAERNLIKDAFERGMVNA